MNRQKFKILFTDYRFYICLGITVAFVLIGYFVFSRSYIRLYESCIDLGTSFAYYFTSFGGNESSITATVSQVPDDFWEFNFLSPDMSLFAPKFYSWWWSLWNMDTFSNFGNGILKGFVIFIQVVMILVLVGVVVWFLLKRYFKPSGKAPCSDSKPLVFHKMISKYFYQPVKNWFVEFYHFLKSYKWFLYVWIFIWALNFDFIVIVIEFFAFYFYFLGSFDFLGLFIQFYKLVGDLVPLLTFIPSYFVAVIIFIYFFNKRRKNRGLNRLRHQEAIDKAVVNSLGVSNLVVGPIGVGKTSTVTDMALSASQNFRYHAFKDMMELDMKFPSFPWIKLEQALNHEIDRGSVVNLATIHIFINRLRNYYSFGAHKLFGYDFDKEKILHYNGLVEEDIFDTLEDYCKLYFIYGVSSSMIVSNYAINEDLVINFNYDTLPSWNFDFFREDHHYNSAYSRLSHILDYDMMRFGKLVDPSNPYRDALEFGVVCVSEIDKERGNRNSTSDKKKEDDLANQKNDDFNNWIKLVRHNATVYHYCYFKFISDLQRVPALNADLVETCECVVNIQAQSETRLALPFSKLFLSFYSFTINRLQGWYERIRYVRSDNTLFSYLVHNFCSFIVNRYNFLINTYGYYELDLSIDSGVDVSTGKDNAKVHKYYLAFKKYRSGRFSSNCFSSFYQIRNASSPYGIYNLPEYSSLVATPSDLKKQHSYLVDSIFDIFNIDGSLDNEDHPGRDGDNPASS